MALTLWASTLRALTEKRGLAHGRSFFFARAAFGRAPKGAILLKFISRSCLGVPSLTIYGRGRGSAACFAEGRSTSLGKRRTKNEGVRCFAQFIFLPVMSAKYSKQKYWYRTVCALYHKASQHSHEFHSRHVPLVFPMKFIRGIFRVTYILWTENEPEMKEELEEREKRLKNSRCDPMRRPAFDHAVYSTRGKRPLDIHFTRKIRPKRERRIKSKRKTTSYDILL